MMFPVATGNVK